MDVVINPPNELDRIEKVYAVLSRDANGKEGVVGFKVPGMGMQPMLTVNPRLWKRIYLPEAERLQPYLGATGKTVHIVEFMARVDVREIKSDAHD
jgi:hypothetical protein